VDFADTEEGESIRTFVQLVQQHDERTLLDVVQNTHADESTANLILSTAHKAKGREWESVRLARDFAKAGADGKPTFNEAESRLFYVAMTRAKRYLAVDSEQLTHFTLKPGDGSTKKIWKRVRSK
jgi:superfamily I DNA/RNA helicase